MDGALLQKPCHDYMHFAVGIDALISLFGLSDIPQTNTLILGLQVPHKGYIVRNIEQTDIFIDCLQKTLFAKNNIVCKKQHCLQKTTLLAKWPTFIMKV